MAVHGVETGQNIRGPYIHLIAPPIRYIAFAVMKFVQTVMRIIDLLILLLLIQKFGLIGPFYPISNFEVLITIPITLEFYDRNMVKL